MTKFSIYLSFNVHYNYTKIGKFKPILSIRIVLCCFYLLISSLFENFSTWISRLPYTRCLISLMMTYSNFEQPMPRLKTGAENDIFWSEIGSGFRQPGGTPPPRNPRSTPSGSSLLFSIFLQNSPIPLFSYIIFCFIQLHVPLLY